MVIRPMLRLKGAEMTPIPIKDILNNTLEWLVREPRCFVTLRWVSVLASSAMLMGPYLAQDRTAKRVCTAITHMAQIVFANRPDPT